MKGREICIISQAHPSMNPRLVKEADALTEAGYRVSVIAPDFSAWARMADQEFENRPWRIVERPKYGPLAPKGTRAAEIARRLAAGLAVKGFGIMHPALVRAAWHPVAPALVTAAKRRRADLYIGHYVSSLPAAAIAARHHQTRYAFDAEDFHPGDLPDDCAHKWEQGMVRSIEGRYLKGCSYVTAAAPMIAQAYRDEYRIELPKTVLNVFPLSSAPLDATPRGTVTPGPTVYWYSQTIGPTRGLECAVRAIGVARTRPHLYLRGQVADGFLELLHKVAVEAGVWERVHVLGRRAPADMEILAAAYDIGLVGETGHTRNRQIALTNKQFTYLLAGLPVVMSDIPAHAAFAQGHECCVQTYRAEDYRSLANAMDTFLESPEALARARRAAFELGQTRYNWDLEKRILLEAVEAALRSG